MSGNEVKVAVLGASGKIASEVIAYLQATGLADVVGFTRFKSEEESASLLAEIAEKRSEVSALMELSSKGALTDASGSEATPEEKAQKAEALGKRQAQVALYSNHPELTPSGAAIEAPVIIHDLKKAFDGADIIVMTAGYPRNASMTDRSVLELKNSEIVADYAKTCGKISPNATVVVVSNPLDLMTALWARESGQNSDRIIGLSGTLDGARFQDAIATELGVHPHMVFDAHVAGQHGKEMVPLFSHVKIFNGSALVPLEEFIADRTDKKELVERIREKTVKGGDQFTHLIDTSDHRGPAGAIVSLLADLVSARSGETDRKPKVYCSAANENGVFTGRAVDLNQDGTVTAVPMELSPDEQARFTKAEGVCGGAMEKLFSSATRSPGN